MEGFLHLPSRETHQNARKGGFRAGFSYSALTLWSPQISDFFEKHSLTLSSPLLTLPEPFSPYSFWETPQKIRLHAAAGLNWEEN